MAMIEHSLGHVYLFAICVLSTFLCVVICVVSGCVHILGAVLVATAAGAMGYRALLVIIDRRVLLDLTPVINVFNNLMALPSNTTQGQRPDLVDDRPSGAPQLDHGAEETRFQNESSTSGVMYEVDLFVQYVMKDFIVSWYANVSSDEQFLREIQYALEDLSVALVSRVRKLDACALLTKALHAYHSYFEAYLAASEKAKQGSQCTHAVSRKGPENFFAHWHFVLVSGQTEMLHLHNMVNVLLEVLLPADVLSCNLMRRLVVNLLACKVLHPLVNLLSDPVYLNQKITALVADSSCRTTEVTMRDPCPPDQAMATEMPDLESTALDNEVCRLESRDDRTMQNDCSFCDGDAQFGRDATLLPAEEFSTSQVGIDESFFEDTPYSSDDVTDVIWQRMADELPSTFWCEHEQEVSQEAASSLELKKKPLRLPLSGSIDKISDLFSNTISFDSISSNIAQYFKSASEEDKSSQVSVEVGSPEDGEPCDSVSQKTGSSGKLNFNPSEDEQRISESVESNEAYVSEDFEPKCSHEKVSLDSTDSLQVCDASTTKIPTLSPSQSETDDVTLFTATFSNLVISGTEVIDDANSGSYVVYCITYEVHFTPTDVVDVADSENYVSALELQALSKTCFVRRRFREFVTLHSRLEDDPKLRALTKGIKGPNKWTMLPFNKLDREAIFERQQVLKHYLQTLLAKDDIASSNHFKEFLAYGNDPSIAYVRKAADVGLPVPRIDKFFMKTMTGVFDKLKTALPSLPHDISPVEPFVNVQQKTSDKFLGFLNFNSSIADENTLRINFDFDTVRDYQICVEGYLSNFLNVFERNNEPADPAYDVAADIDAWCQHPCSSPSDSEKLNTSFTTSPSVIGDTSVNGKNIGCDKFIDDEIPLASALINLAVETIKIKDLALNCEPFVQTVKILFGRILERWMCELVTKYTCEKMFAKYLKIIRESLWPNGVFGVQATVPPSECDRKRIFTETLKTLKKCLPELILVILGKAQCDSGMELVFDSLQHPKMLRHFIYHLMDLIVEALLIRSRSQSIIDKLSSLS